MKAYPSLRRGLAALATGAVFAGLLILLNSSARSLDTERAQQAKSQEWPMWAGSLSRNMVNTMEHDIATDWSVQEGAQKNIKWVADLGSKAYGGPIIGGGKMFRGTNNEKPRNPK